MGAAISGLLILAFFFTSAMMLFRINLFGDIVIRDAMKSSNELEAKRARSAISITSTDDPSVFRCDTKVDATIKNLGLGTISDFDQMDVLTWYTNETGDSVTVRFTYSEGNLGKGEWSLPIIDPDDINPGLWDPDESGTLTWRLVQPQKDDTSGYIIVGTPDGVYDSDYVEFSNVVSGNCRFLHNNPSPPTADTDSQAVLPVDSDVPAAATLYNYDKKSR